ncbi:bacterial extracellular solute-binding s, 3 family protein [Burkholderia ambifaria AMMD]|uniref:Amino acid ABC transporter substrate-binding protein, PAAT family n=1 Tax=Burkholderia ambifaria (strain ATCC BAA-244 / DSM 16087 / CCUG 44356 / LMG 19182 / AMMD) TaxID=339670 RepID=Q0B230_BURCM|nr:amino acid ABC transporter substrate-binding protein [Burkholderia ambifaria]ABI91793.1 amino acid ABC transporter substrate-binding protein, PAAT family [Burkholderia ambifaria AMMD]AJY26039.1 bacterial extracellular solute-binding s, 3 family protein [Burkholderia ambifaria AMMD]MBR7932432.1 amino acid ABC transporter substrate-binding protein [Burkholderia ambifaria]PEH70344.1 amino acid ABC transporter substrate-binding protein [Burkholderia ambifaria]QQC08481.1 amino acid ABC transport
MKMQRFWRALALAGLLAAGATARADDAPAPPPRVEPLAPAQLTGTLAKVRSSGTIALGYRDASIPFSYLNARNQPIGYSIELCKALVSSIEDAVNKSLTIRWVPVTSDNRIDAVVSGNVDLECGSTTSNLERQQRVAFSPIIFVAGTKVMVKRGSPIRSFRDLAAKKVAVTAGTTNEKALRDLDARFKLGIQLQVVPDHAQGFALVASGRADAFATDDVLLYGLIAENAGKGGQYDVVGDYLSYDPYGIMFRKDDPQLAQVVKSTFEELAVDGEITRQYKRWFLRPLPSGVSLNLPMSQQLKTIIDAIGIKSE